MSEGPYRNMSYEDAVNAMSRIYKLLYPRKFHSYNPSLDEPFADYVGTRKEKDPIPEEYTKFYGKIGNVMEKYTPILGDISYGVDETADTIPANASKVILDLHGMAILNSLLEVAELIEKRDTDKVGLGTTVKIMYDGDEDDTEEYRIVGSKEADPSNNKISNESPLAKAIMGAKVGDTCTVESPNGNYEVEVLEIK